MREKPLVSVIVPIYNVERYLSKCIDSIIKQDYEKIEIILVCDGSPDSSLSICEKYKKIDKRIVVIDKKNGGVSSARNYGLRDSSGKYVIFVDADDWLESNFISYMVSLIENESCDFGLSLNSIKSEKVRLNQQEEVKVISPVEATALLISTRVDVGCWNKIYKRELLIENNIFFDEKQYYGEGLLFITTVAQLAKKTFVTNKELYHYRQDNLSSATKKYNFDKYINGAKSLDIIRGNLMYNDESINKQLNIHYCLFFCNAIYDTYVNKEVRTNLEQYKYWKKEVKKYFKLISKYKEITIKRKIFIWMILVCPKLLYFIKKVKLKIKKEK